LVWKQLQQGSFRWPPIMNGVMKLSPVEFAALFDGLDWTRVQTVARQLGWPVRDTKVVRSQRSERMAFMTSRDKRCVAPNVKQCAC
jgi:transposase